MATEAMRMTDRVPVVGTVVRKRPMRQYTHYCECGKHMFAFMYYPQQSTSYTAQCADCGAVQRFTHIVTADGVHEFAKVERVVQQ